MLTAQPQKKGGGSLDRSRSTAAFFKIFFFEVFTYHMPVQGPQERLIWVFMCRSKKGHDRFGRRRQEEM